MREAPELDGLERWMLAAITHEDGAGAGVDSQAARALLPVTAESLETVVQPSAELTALERLQVYASSYYWRLIDVLAEDFPTVQHVLGEDAFADLARRFLRAHPSRSYTLSKLGAPFPGFLRGQDLEHGAFLADVATIEWAMEEVFAAEHAEPIDTDRVLSVPAEEFAAKRFRVVPAFRLLRLEHPANEFIAAVREERDMDIPAAATRHVLVYRNRHYRVYRVTQTPAQFALLAAMARGETLGDALSACAEVPEVDFEELAGSLHEWFRVWSGDGLFRAIE